MWMPTISSFAFAVFLVILGILIFYTIYLLYVRRQYSHLPGPKVDNFFLGNIPHFWRERKAGKIFYEIIKDWAPVYGPVFVLWAFHKPFVVAIGPEATKKVLITLNLPKSKDYAKLQSVFGERATGQGILTERDHNVWLRKRTMLNPAFNRKYLMNLMPAFNSTCDQFIERLRSFADKDTKVNIAVEFSKVTLNVISKVAFNVDMNAIQDDNCPFLLANYLVLKGMQESFKDLLWRYNVFKYPFQWKVMKAARFVREFGERVIKERIDAIQQGQDTPNDILQHIVMMAATNSSTTMEELVDNFVTFFIAGQETTSNQLSFTVFEVGKNPIIEQRIVQEVTEVLEGRPYVAYEDLSKLQYLGQTLKESLRYHPPINGLSRDTDKAIELGGYAIPAGTTLALSQLVTQRSADAWNQPDTFDPDRFCPSQSANITGSVYFPFSSGPRSCIGKNLAQFEAKVLMARMYQEFELQLLSHDLLYEETLTMRPRNGIWCKVRTRLSK